MNAAIERSGVIAAVGFQQRYDPWHVAMHEYLQGKRVVMATMVHTGIVESHNANTHADRSPWRTGQPGVDRVSRLVRQQRCGSRHSPDRPGCASGAARLTPYKRAMSLATLLLSLPRAIIRLAYSVTYTFANGAVGHLIMSRLAGVFHQETYMHILWGSRPISALNRMVRSLTSTRARIRPRRLRPLKSCAIPCRQGDRGDSTFEVNRAFVQAVAQRNPSAVRSPFHDAMHSLAAVLGANISSMRNGARVSLEELLRSPG